MDREEINMDTMPLRWGHFRVLIVASLGQLIGAALATLVGILLPMIQIHIHPELSSLEQGVICCASLIGITFGSFVIGNLSDRFGYLLFFRLCPIIVFLSSLTVYYYDNLTILVIGLFIMGFAIGGEYSLDGDYISEIMPRKWKLFMVGVAKSSCAIGNILMASLCYLLLTLHPTPELWNKLILIISSISLVMILLRIRFAQSPGWLIAHDRPDEAEKSVRYFLGKDVQIGEFVNHTKMVPKTKIAWKEQFSKDNIRKILFSGIPWACEGLGVYGIGVFLPILVMALDLDPSSSIPIERVVESIKITTFITLFIVIGFGVGLYYINKIYHIKMQTIGFVASGCGLIILLIAYILHLHIAFAIAGLMIFELFLNFGPHLVTYIIPSQIYPISDRGFGSSLATSCGKVGAILGVLFMPLLLKWGGVKLVLLVTAAFMFLGALVTLLIGTKVLPNPHAQSKNLAI